MEERLRRNQETRGDNVEIPDSPENEYELHPQNPYYTDEDDPYIPPEGFQNVRRMSDSSSDSVIEKNHHRGMNDLSEEVLRNINEDMNQINDMESKNNPSINLPGLDGKYKRDFLLNIKIDLFNV